MNHPKSDLLYQRYSGVPTVSDATGNQMARYFTFTQRSDANRIPVRTLDYLFAAPMITIERYSVERDFLACWVCPIICHWWRISSFRDFFFFFFFF